MNLDERGYYNISEAATLLGVNRSTIWRWIRDGRLPAARLGHRTTRITHEDLEQLLDQGHPSLASGVQDRRAPVGAEDRDAGAVPPPVTAEIAVAPARLRQVLTSLVDNAIKCGPEGSPIDVVVSPAAPEVVELSVRDRGPGMPPGQRIQNFERFYRSHGAGHKSGLGLGQLISRQIVDLHGGEIRAEYPPEGGARFVVRLPIGLDKPGERLAD